MIGMLFSLSLYEKYDASLNDMPIPKSLISLI